MSGGSVPKNLVSFFTLEGLERAGSSESLINGWDCDLTIAILVWVLSAAISPLMFSISCEYLIVVSFDSFFRLFLLSFQFVTLFCCWIWFEDNSISIHKLKKFDEFISKYRFNMLIKNWIKYDRKLLLYKNNCLKRSFNIISKLF